jgi:hypothetical protein
MIKKWFMREACWYQFWFPQSGPIGGIIFSAIINATIYGVILLKG